MIEYIIPALVVGFVAGSWRAAVSLRDEIATRDKQIADDNRAILALNRRNEVLKVVNTALHQELDVHVKRKLAADAQRREAGKLGNAAQAAKKISKDAQARLIKQARHSEMRKLVGHLV